MTWDTAPRIPTGVRDYCHIRATVVMIYKNSCCFLLHFSTLTSLITHITPFIIQERLVTRVWFHEKRKCGQQYKEIKANFALYWYCFRSTANKHTRESKILHKIGNPSHDVSRDTPLTSPHHFQMSRRHYVLIRGCVCAIIVRKIASCFLNA